MKIPKEIHWEITNACNLRCHTCLPASGNPRPLELTFGRIKQILRVLTKNGVEKICFTGGEPFQRPDFLEILAATVTLGIEAEVITNGTLLTPSIIEWLSDNHVSLGISIDGARPQTHDLNRGHNSFRRTVFAIEDARRRNIPVRLYVTVTDANFDELEAIGTLAYQYGCSIHVSEVTLAGRALTSPGVSPLTLGKHDRLPHVVAKIAQSVYGEEISHLEDGCWIGSDSAWFIRSDGNIYVCSEVALRQPDHTIGNIRTLLTGQKSAVSQPDTDNSKDNECCYRVWASSHITLIGNTRNICPFTRTQQRIETLRQLYDELDGLYPEMRQFCGQCEDPDCMGYTWLLPEEAQNLVDNDIPIVEINDGVYFIHSFLPKEDGTMDVEAPYPVCRLVQNPNRRCSIYDQRPMVCRLWPVGFETQNGEVVIALHLDCLFVKYLQTHDEVARLSARCLDLMARLSPELKETIISTYRSVDAIAKFPDGENRYLSLGILTEGG